MEFNKVGGKSPTEGHE